MKPGRVLLVYALAVFAGGALLAPWLYWLVQWGGAHGLVSASLTRYPFDRFVRRALLVLALVGLWPLLRGLGAHSWREVGWAEPKGQGGRLAAGFGLGFASLALVVALALLAGGREFQPDLPVARLLRKLGSAALSAVVVSVLEETLFRGGIFGGLRRAHSWGLALGASSAIYALVHFFQRPAPPVEVNWDSGLLTLAGMMHGFVEWKTLVPGFFTLTLAGLMLGLAYQRTGNLYFSAGLHAGWIFWLKFANATTQLRSGADAWVWSSGKVVDGWLAMVALSGVLVVLLRYWRRPLRSDEPKPVD
jgi:uncharacterized protein